MTISSLPNGWTSEVPTEEGIYVQRTRGLYLILDIATIDGVLSSRQNACFPYYPLDLKRLKGYEYLKLQDQDHGKD